MKKILMIAPSCYPVNCAEAIVNIKLLKVLSDSNQFSIDLISRKRKWEKYPSDSLESFGIQLNTLKIIEVDNVINVSTILQIVLTYLKFGILVKGYHWAYPAWKVIKQLVKTNDYDYVLTKDVPSLALGYYLKKHYGFKWVATWNDPCPGVMYPKPYGKGLDAKRSIMTKRLIEIMRTADVHIFPNKRLCDYMNHYLQITKSNQILIVPHVIIPTTFDKEYVPTDTLRLVHSGNLGNPRNPRTFLIAFRRFIDNNPEANLTFTILGHCNSLVNTYISELNLGKYVFFIPPVKYIESLQKLVSYDVSVIIEADCQEGIFLPTKVSDFMQMSIPIFAVSPQKGVLNDLYNEKQIAYFSPVDDIDSICLQLQKIYEDFLNKRILRNDNYLHSMTKDYVVKQYLDI